MKIEKPITHEDLYQMIQKNSVDIQDLTSLIKDFIGMANERFNPLETRTAKYNIQFSELAKRLEDIKLRQQHSEFKATHIEKFLSRKRYLPQLKPIND